MQTSKFIIYSVLILAAALAYTFLTLTLVNNILERARIKAFGKMLVSVVNVIFLALSLFLKSSTTDIFYIGIIIIFFLEFYIFHKDTILRCAFVTLACAVHVMVIRAVCVSVFSITTGVTFHSVVNNPETLMLSSAITLTLLVVAILLVLKLIPVKKLKIINQHQEQLYFMVAWLAVSCIYLIINSQIYSLDENYSLVNKMEILTPITIIIGVYIMLFFAFKTSSLLGYKEKNSVLELKMEQEMQYRDSMLSDSLMTYEINLTQNMVISGFDGYEEVLGRSTIHDYKKMVFFMSENVIHSDDLITFIDIVNPANLLERFEKGASEQSVEYRRLMPNGEYLWVKTIANLVRDSATGDVKALCHVKNIDKKKKEQMELKFKAERDSLTGLYNKGATAKLIGEYLAGFSDCETTAGTLFIVDIDAFKAINDNLGHIFGDAVLRELSGKLEGCFKTSDIVGRIGGDEFMAFIKGFSDPKAIEIKALEICREFYNTYKGTLNQDYVVSGSVGVASFPENGLDFETLYRNADTALYASKASGKNIYTIYKDGQNYPRYLSERGAE